MRDQRHVLILGSFFCSPHLLLYWVMLYCLFGLHTLMWFFVNVHKRRVYVLILDSTWLFPGKTNFNVETYKIMMAWSLDLIHPFHRPMDTHTHTHRFTLIEWRAVAECWPLWRMNHCWCIELCCGVTKSQTAPPNICNYADTSAALTWTNVRAGWLCAAFICVYVLRGCTDS